MQKEFNMNIRYHNLYIVILPLLFVILFCTLSVHAYKSSKLLSSKDLIYKGAFAYPAGDE